MHGRLTPTPENCGGDRPRHHHGHPPRQHAGVRVVGGAGTTPPRNAGNRQMSHRAEPTTTTDHLNEAEELVMESGSSADFAKEANKEGNAASAIFHAAVAIEAAAKARTHALKARLAANTGEDQRLADDAELHADDAEMHAAIAQRQAEHALRKRTAATA